MKAIQFFIALLLSLCTVSCTSSLKDDEEEELGLSLTFEKSTYNAMMKVSTSIPILGGSRDYELTVADAEILDASINLTSNTGKGNIYVRGKKKGETTITIFDKVTGETATLKIKTNDLYISFFILKSSYPAIPQGSQLFLVDNESEDFYVYETQSSDQQILRLKGNYHFYALNGQPHATLAYQEDGQTKTYIFNLSQSNKGTLSFISTYLTRSTEREYLIFQEVDSSNLITASATGATIPEGVLD